MKKKWTKILLTILLLFFLSLVFIGYMLTEGYRNYKSFCSQYIPKIDKYYSVNGMYPLSLNQFESSIIDFRYNSNNCRYSINKEGYTFLFLSGVTLIGYDSLKQKWWYD